MASSIYRKIVDEMLKSLDMMQDSYLQEMYHCMAIGMFCLVFSYSAFVGGNDDYSVQEHQRGGYHGMAGCLSAFRIEFCGEYDCRVVNGLLTVKIDTGFFVLFDEKPDLLWKIPMIAVLIFAGEAALIYFWQRYRASCLPRGRNISWRNSRSRP